MYMGPNRRKFLTLTGIIATAGFARTAEAATHLSGTEREIAGALNEVRALNQRALEPASGGFVSPRASLVRAMNEAISKAASGDEAANALTDRLGILMSELTRDERDGNPPGLAPAAALPLDDRLRAEYADMFKRAEVKSNQAELNWAAKLIADTQSKEQYAAAGEPLLIPWYVVGALHYREASLGFMQHLHNGDFLKAKTYHVPAGRPAIAPWPPVPWDPKAAWQISAQDAMQREFAGTIQDFRISKVSDWTVPQILYAFEKFNGMGYRLRNRTGSNRFVSPYLWNYTQFYTGGGYPRDHEWSDTYRSKQAGLVAILKTLEKIGAVKF